MVTLLQMFVLFLALSPADHWIRANFERVGKTRGILKSHVLLSACTFSTQLVVTPFLAHLQNSDVAILVRFLFDAVSLEYELHSYGA